VTTAELLAMVNIALGHASVEECGAGDPDDDGRINVAEILAAVNNVLHGCAHAPTPTATFAHCGDGHIEPPEECDTGNLDPTGCSNCHVDVNFMCFGEPSECFIVNCSGPNPTCSGGPALVVITTPTPPGEMQRMATPTPTATPTPDSRVGLPATPYAARPDALAVVRLAMVANRSFVSIGLTT
jgi:cysteine-rich repeat protein